MHYPLWKTLAACVLGACGFMAVGPAHSNSLVGAWQTWNTLPFFPVHVSTLPTGKVLIWPGDAGINGDDARLLDPATQNLTLVPKAGYDLFCSSHAFLSNGQLLVAGGHISNGVGLARATRYDPFANAWLPVPDMNAGRWYPTVTTLANGDALVVSGDVDSTVGVNQQPQVYQRATNNWRSLSNAQLSQPLYPMMFVAPNGRVVEVAPSVATRSLDTSGTGQWTTITSRGSGQFRSYGSAVMYADGKVLVVGGADPPVSSAEVIDLNQPQPAWRNVASMSVARRQLNATALPDGTVLVTGGTYGAGFNNETTPVYTTELWNPATETWAVMASATKPRLYHSAATLLPDGRVLVTGGNNQLVPEVFSPPYLFKGARPTMGTAPAAIAYGQRFTVGTPQAAAIAKVTLIRLTSVTHGFNENQRLTVLPFAAGSGSVELTAPANGNAAPPGHYLLFLVDGNGVPSVGQVVQLSADGPPPPPPPPPPLPAMLASLAPGTATAGGPAFTLTVGGTGFAPGAAVQWNGAGRSTMVVSATQVSAQILASDVSTPGTANVTVVNPNAVASNALPFTVVAGPSYRLSVAKAGSQASRGTVTSTPAGISCGSTCAANFAPGSNVTLSARAVGNVVFIGWSGACNGTGACTVSLNANTDVIATFGRR